MQRTNAARRAATFCRAASGHIDRKKSNKQQAASNKLQAGGWVPRQQAATFRALNQELAVVIWSRAARELVSTIQYQPCEACLWGEAGGSSQQKGNICKNLHLSLTTKNLKWRIRSTSTVYQTTRWVQPTIISTFLKELGSVHGMAAQLTPGSGTEETFSINITALAAPAAGAHESRPAMSSKRQATSSKLQAASERERSNKQQAASA